MASKLQVDVDVDVRGQDKLRSLGSGLKSAGGELLKWGAVGVAGLGALGVATTKLAADAEKSSAKLTAAFKNMGSTSGKSLQQLQDQATALGEATTFDDEGIMEAQAALLTFGTVSGEAFDRALQGAADYAAATDTDLTAATKAFGKALADPEKGLARLSRMGIVFTKQQEKQVKAMVEAGDTAGAQEVILSGLESRYKGVNEALSNTAAGEAAQAFEDLENAGEDIGAIFLPILAAVARGIQEFAHFIRDNMPAIKAVVETVMGAIGAAFNWVATNIFPLFSQSARQVGGVFGAIGSIIQTFTTTVLPTLIAIFQKVVSWVAENWPTISSVFGQVFGAIANAVKVVWPILARIAEVLFPLILAAASVLLKGLDGIFKLIGGIFEVAGTVAETMVQGIVGAWTILQAATTAVWGAVTGIITGAINGVIDVINGFLGFLNGFRIGIPEINVGPVHVGGGVIDPFNIPLIPHLASGGIIDSPTLALIGERGPEAVVPLSKARDSFGSTRILNLDIQAPLRANDAEDIAEYIDRVERLQRAMDWEAAHG